MGARARRRLIVRSMNLGWNCSGGRFGTSWQNEALQSLRDADPAGRSGTLRIRDTKVFLLTTPHPNPPCNPPASRPGGDLRARMANKIRIRSRTEMIRLRDSSDEDCPRYVGLRHGEKLTKSCSKTPPRASRHRFSRGRQRTTISLEGDPDAYAQLDQTMTRTVRGCSGLMQRYPDVRRRSRLLSARLASYAHVTCPGGAVDM